MRRRSFLYGLGGAGIVSASGLPAFAKAATQPAAGLRIAFDESAPGAVREAAASVVNANTHPLLNAMSPAREQVSSRKLLTGAFADRAYNHIVAIGLMSDPLIETVWLREAKAAPGGMYIFGFGTLAGDLGYIESGRNVFLHSKDVPIAPFETEVVTITGTTPAGVALAVDAFLNQHLINGVVAAPGWKRPAPGLLDRDPLAPRFALPRLAPAEVLGKARIGMTQSSEDEYRGVLADTGLMPRALWRAKYYIPNAWAQANGPAAFDAFSCGLHRRAYGNTRWIAEFASEADAAAAAPRIASAAHLQRAGSMWSGNQPFYADAKVPTDPGHGPLVLWQAGTNVVMSTIPNDEA